MQKVDVIIPTYHPSDEFEELLKKIEEQEYSVHKIIVMNTEEKFWDEKWEKKYPLLEVHHIEKKEFDHGKTRKIAAGYSDSDFMVFMTQDAIPYDKKLIGELLKPFKENMEIAAVYGRQLPMKDCNELEKYTRAFNYPPVSSVKTKADLPKYGIKTFFCSNVCAAYRKDIFEKLGGFVEKTIFNEDMIYAGRLIEHGYAVAYAAEAKVWHSHNYSCMQQLHRNFDLGVSQAQYPEIFGGIASEGEGIRLVKQTMVYLLKNKKWWMIPELILKSACKYIGFFAGKRYKKLPEKLVQWLSMNKSYWNN